MEQIKLVKCCTTANSLQLLILLTTCNIGDEGVEKLVEHLKFNQTINHLDLYNNNH